jgi:hypothetical protein
MSTAYRESILAAIHHVVGDTGPLTLAEIRRDVSMTLLPEEIEEGVKELVGRGLLMADPGQPGRHRATPGRPAGTGGNSP